MQLNTARFAMLLFTALLFTAILMPQLAFAADFDRTVKLEGEENFSLTASEMQLFDFENIAPGDTRTGKLHIENTTDTKMECRILSVMSYSQDKRLFDAMRLHITDWNGTDLYTGPYGGNGSDSLAVILLTAHKVRTLNIEVSFPADMGNEYQDAEMDSIWTFEARVFDKKTPSDSGDKGDSKKDDNNGDDDNGDGTSNIPSDSKGDHSDGPKEDKDGKQGSSEQGSGSTGKDSSGVKTGLDLTLSNSGFIVGLILIGLCFLASIITVIRIYAAKRNRKNRK